MEEVNLINLLAALTNETIGVVIYTLPGKNNGRT
jgi:hypothetical protein